MAVCVWCSLQFGEAIPEASKRLYWLAVQGTGDRSLGMGSTLLCNVFDSVLGQGAGHA